MGGWHDISSGAYWPLATYPCPFPLLAQNLATTKQGCRPWAGPPLGTRKQGGGFCSPPPDRRRQLQTRSSHHGVMPTPPPPDGRASGGGRKYREQGGRAQAPARGGGGGQVRGSGAWRSGWYRTAALVQVGVWSCPGPLPQPPGQALPHQRASHRQTQRADDADGYDWQPQGRTMALYLPW